jgi:hypothetical protein
LTVGSDQELADWVRMPRDRQRTCANDYEDPKYGSRIKERCADQPCALQPAHEHRDVLHLEKSRSQEWRIARTGGTTDTPSGRWRVLAVRMCSRSMRAPYEVRMSWDKLLIIVVAFLYSCVMANAQSPRGFIAGQTLMAAELNSAFSAKRDYPVITQLPGKRRPTTAFVQQAISSGGLVGTFTNVKTFGATGNGTTDDCTAITTAMSALNSAGGGTLYFPPGTYNEASCGMFIPNNVVVQGAGSDATIKKGTSNPCAINMAMTMTGADSSQWAAQNTTYAIKTPTLRGTTVTMTTAANARNLVLNGRRQPSRGGTSRMMRECQVRNL